MLHVLVRALLESILILGTQITVWQNSKIKKYLYYLQPWTLDSSISEENRAVIEKMLLEEEYPFLMCLYDFFFLCDNRKLIVSKGNGQIHISLWMRLKHCHLVGSRRITGVREDPLIKWYSYPKLALMLQSLWLLHSLLTIPKNSHSYIVYWLETEFSWVVTWEGGRDSWKDVKVGAGMT